MVHLRNTPTQKTYVPIPGFSERPPPVLPQWVINRTKSGPRRSQRAAQQCQQAFLNTATVASSPSTQNYQQSYFNVSSMRNKPRLGFGDGGWSLTGGGVLSEGGEKKPGVLPRVTGTSINPSSSPRSATRLVSHVAGEDQVEEAGYLDQLESVSMLGADTGRGLGQHADTQSVATLDALSVITDHTVDELPFQVTFTKAPPRQQPPPPPVAPTATTTTDRSRTCISPKSVRFSLPGKDPAALEEVGVMEPTVEPQGTGTGTPAGCVPGTSGKNSDMGGSVVDGFFVQSNTAWPLSATALNITSSSPHPNTVRGSSGGGGPAMSNDGSMVVGSAPSSAPPTCSSPVMRTRGALSNSRQIPGRYFPPLALCDDHRFSPAIPTSLPSTNRLYSGTSTSGSARGPGGRNSSSASVVSAPPALGTASITQLHRGGTIPSFAVTSSYSWAGNGSGLSFKTNNINDNITTPAHKDEDRRKSIKARTMGLGSIGIPRSGPMDNINRDSNRDTVYNRNKRGFWDLYDADPGRFTISFRAEAAAASAGTPAYDPTDILQSDYYCVRKSHEVPVRTASARTKKKPGSPFQGCLEGTSKRIHLQKPKPRTPLKQ